MYLNNNTSLCQRSLCEDNSISFSYAIHIQYRVWGGGLGVEPVPSRIGQQAAGLPVLQFSPRTGLVKKGGHMYQKKEDLKWWFFQVLRPKLYGRKRGGVRLEKYSREAPWEQEPSAFILSDTLYRLHTMEYLTDPCNMGRTCQLHTHRGTGTLPECVG